MKRQQRHLWWSGPCLAAMLCGLGVTASMAVQAAGEESHAAVQAAHDGHSPQPEHSAGEHGTHQGLFNQGVGEARPAKVRLHDLTLVDQAGTPYRFASQLVGDWLVALNIFYSDCTTVCPVTSAIFAQLQTRLGDRLGREVRLLSLTVDPITDTPARLYAQAAAYGARPGWFWITGEKSRVDQVLDGLGLYAADFREHPAAVVVGDGRTGTWHRFYGFSSPEQILEQLNRLLAAREAVPERGRGTLAGGGTGNE